MSINLLYKMMNRSIQLGAILVGVFSTHVLGFDLFNPDRGMPAPSQIAPTPTIPTLAQGQLPNPFPRARKPLPPIPKPPKPLLPQKDFVLRGTSLIGKQRSVVLKGPDSKEFIQKLENDQRTPITGYPDYYLLGVNAREIQLEYPADAPCRTDNPQQGIKCNKEDNGKTVALSLQRQQALPPRPVSIPPPQPSPAQSPVAAGSTPPLTTLDEIRARREEARKKREELYKNFQRRVIKDEEVPPGMRVVRTPFGDRLVPMQQ
jgi:hypothetical protein